MDGKLSLILFTIVSIFGMASSQSYAAAGDSSFTPTSVVVPITEIRLENASGDTALLYSCSGGTLADCGVNVADPSALAALSLSSNITPGTYDHIGIGTCQDTGSYDATLTGSVNIAGTDYYTTTPANPGVDDVLSTSSANLGPVTVHYNGCVHSYPLASPVTVAAGDSIVVNLFVNLENIAWARTASVNTIPSGCVTNSGGAGTQAVCMAYPDVVASIGTETPKVQTYHVTINSSGQVDGQFILIYNSDGTPIGGFTRPYYDATNSMSYGFDTPLRTFTLNGDGVSYTLGNYGNGANNYTLLISDFIPGTTAGDISTGLFDATSPEDAGLSYSAVLQ